MADLDTFRQRIQELYRAADPFEDGHRPTATDLAREIGLSRTELSRRLSGKGKVPLSCANAAAIVRVLAMWGAVQTQAAVIELLAVLNCPSFKFEEWQTPPLDHLAPLSPAAQARLERGSNNLPLPLTSFVGREQELVEIAALLATTRLLTISGGGGMGKTRLAAELASSLLGEYQDGCWLVALAPLADGQLVVRAVAQALGVREEPRRALAETLRDYLRPRKLLLVLDNCEHLLAACAALVKLLLANCSQLQIVITSREPLGITGETEWRLSPLILPNHNEPLSREQIGDYAAVSLFVARVQAVSPRFRLTERNVASVVQICQQLEGIPLALELAAPLVKALTVEQLAHRLDNRFRLLHSSDPAAPTRQQTLRASIEWSYDLLTEAERQLLRCLAVFAGGWTLEAAEVICSDFASPILDFAVGETPDQIRFDPKSKIENPKLDVLGGHIQLVNKSLVQVSEQDGAARYSMLELIRQFADERLANSGEEAIMRLRHARLYLTLAEQAEAELHGPQQVSWLERLEHEHDNLRAALDWWLGRDEAAPALRMASALCRFWLVRGYLQEGERWLEQSLARDAPGSALKAKALTGLGHLYIASHDEATARLNHEQALAIYRSLDDKAGMVIALDILGGLARNLGEYDAAYSAFEEGLSLARKLGDQDAIAKLVYDLGNLIFERGNYPFAIELHQQSLAHAEEQGDKRGTAFSLCSLGLTCWAQGDYPTAYAHFVRGLPLLQEVGDSISLSIVQTNLGMLTTDQGDYQAANEYLAQGLALRQVRHDHQAIAESLTSFATLAAAFAPAEAALLFGAAAARREALGIPVPFDELGRYARYLAIVRDRLDEAAFNSAWSMGHTMTEEQAIARALSLPILSQQ